MSKVQDIRKSSLTFAPEAGSQRLRDVINKGLTRNILHGAGLAFEGGWNKVKLYFMLGQPTETVEDMKAIGELAEEIAERYYEIPKDQRNGKCQITVSTSFFVPKPFTPFQWSPMCTKDEFLGRAKIVNETIKSQLNKKSIRYNWHEADVTMIEGILARGDRRLCDTMIKIYEKGGILQHGLNSLMSRSGWMHLQKIRLIPISIQQECEAKMSFSHGTSSMQVSPKTSCCVNGMQQMQRPLLRTAVRNVPVAEQ